jgi:GNAT superfamily N-acetyltransferase
VIAIKEAVLNDAPLVLEFINKKARFDSDISGEARVVTITLEKIKQTLLNDSPFAKVIFAKNADNETLGFALYHTRYSSFSGQPSIWLDDLLVDDSARSNGVGKELMLALEDRAKDINASHLAWNANVKNVRGQAFYKRFGAELERVEGTALFYRYSI